MSAEEDLRNKQLAIEYYNRGNTLINSKEIDGAIANYREAIVLDPNFAEAYDNLGNVLKGLGRLDEAIASYEHAIGINPDFSRAHYNLGNALGAKDKLDEAIESYQKAVDIQPNYAAAHYNLANTFARQGKLDSAAVSYRNAFAVQRDFGEAHSNLLFMEQSRFGHTAETLFALHCEWDERQSQISADRELAHDNSREPERRLRIGFVSPDLGRHPVGYFISGLIENYSNEEIETVAYSDRLADDLTEKIKAATDEWNETRDISDNALAEKISADKIDILFDLAGHGARNRLKVFTFKPAPIQITWAGYVGTTGLSAMDYCISDPVSTPEEEECFYSEKIIRMPDCWVCYTAPEYAPDLVEPPCLENSYITFGCFNHPRKLNSNVLKLWADILENIPKSRLFLKYRRMNSNSNMERIVSYLLGRGLDASRLIFEGEASHLDFLSCYNRVDIALDPFPYSGGLTTLESLWMGVPVVTLSGKTFASRHSSVCLTAMGLTNLIAKDLGEYMNICQDLAKHTARLKDLRATLRARLKNSPICDGKSYSESFSRAMRDIWKKWCFNVDAEAINVIR